MIKTSHDDPDTAAVIESANRGSGNEVTVAYLNDFDEEGVWPRKLAEHCAENGIKCYTYGHSELEFAGGD